MAAHTGSRYEATMLEIKLVATNIRIFLSLSPEMLPSSKSAVEGAIQIGTNDLAIVIYLYLEPDLAATEPQS